MEDSAKTDRQICKQQKKKYKDLEEKDGKIERSVKSNTQQKENYLYRKSKRR